MSERRIKTNVLDANAILDRLAEARQIPPGWGHDAALARELGVTSKRISAWRERRSVDHDLIAFKCREWEISINWVYFGDGSPQLSPAAGRPDSTKMLRVLLRTLNEQLEQMEREDSGVEGTVETDVKG